MSFLTKLHLSCRDDSHYDTRPGKMGGVGLGNTRPGGWLDNARTMPCEYSQDEAWAAFGWSKIVKRKMRSYGGYRRVSGKRLAMQK